jgi:hypothetical protein
MIRKCSTVFDLSSLFGVNRYPTYRPPYYGGAGGFPGMYPGGAGGFPGAGFPGAGGYGAGGGYPGGGGYGTNFIGSGGYGNGYGGVGGNNGLDAYNGYNNRDYQGGGNLGYGYYSSDVFENRNTQPKSVPSGYRGYN